jgi:hypothetical protein
MQWLDDDIDDIYRSAAEFYRLDIQGASWNNVAPRIKAINNKKRTLSFTWYIYTGMSIMLLHLWLAHNPSNGRTWASTSFNNENNSSPTIQINIQNNNFSTASEGNQKSARLTVHDHEYQQRSKQIPLHEHFPENKISTKSFRLSGPFDPIDKKSDQISSLVHTSKSKEIISSLLPKRKKEIQWPEKARTLNIPLITPIRTNSSNKSYKYLEIITGIDISNVHFQKYSSPGWIYGLRIGTMVSSGWSLETGILGEQKSYYSEGEYFNTKLFPNAEVQQVEGRCSMLEIPLNIGYMLSNRDRHDWMIKTGISSYLMQQESYAIDYITSGSSTTQRTYKTYTHSRGNWFAAFGIYSDYDFKLWGKGSLRIEPYLKFPLKGMGKGQLPITSAGLTVGWRLNSF